MVVTLWGMSAVLTYCMSARLTYCNDMLYYNIEGGRGAMGGPGVHIHTE